MHRPKNAPAAFLQAFAALALLACESPREPARVPPPPPNAPVASEKPAPLPPTPPAPVLPPGVLAESSGKTGVVRVVERDGFRLLTIDDTVHAAHPIGPGEMPLAASDPLVSILVSARNEQKARTLVVGLGSGATATELATVGHEVHVAELEPAVIELARAFFDYQGHAEPVDGLAWLRKDEPAYELILIDAFAGRNVPRSFLDPEAVKLVRKRVAPEGLVAVRMLGAPRDEAVLAAVRAYAGAFAHVRLYGTGAADEPQNLYLLLSDGPLRLFDDNLGLTFALPLPDGEGTQPASGEEARRDVVMGRRERRASLVGYLVRGEDDTLCLDLPHWEMGARRFLLRGEEAERLKKLLPAKTTFPTAGDISTDGDLSGTLHSLLGGAGVKLSAVRYSPVVVAVEGKLAARVPETAGKFPGPSTEPGKFNVGSFMSNLKKITANAEGELTIERVHFTLDMATWRAFRQKSLRPLAGRAKTALAKGDLAAGAREIGAMLAALDKQFGRFAPRIVTYDELATLAGVLPRPAEKAPTDAMAEASRCDEARETYRNEYGGQWSSVEDDKDQRPPSTVLVGLFECATRKYEQASAKSPQSEVRQQAAARLVELLEGAGWDEFDDKQRDALEKRAEALQKKWFPEPPDHP